MPKTLLLILFSFKALAQMTSASFFPNKRGTNPATIAQRKVRMISVSTTADQVSKEQDISATSGNGSKAETSVTVSSLNFFYGGKTTGGAATEFFVDNAIGKKEEKLINSSSEVVLENDIQSSLIGFGFGVNRSFGVAIMRATYEFTADSTYTFNGRTSDYQDDFDAQSMIFRLGYLNTKRFKLGFFVQRSVSTNRSEASDDNSGESSVIGIGIGGKSSKFRADFGHERVISDDTDDNDDLNPMKTYITLETKIWGLVLGYTRTIIEDGYTNVENSLYERLVHENSTGRRSENSFNIAFRSKKGHSLGGSLFYSKTTSTENNVVIGGTEEYDTETLEQGLSIVYGYAF